MFRAAGLKPIAVVLTGGERVTRGHDGEYHVPKAHLINLLEVKLKGDEFQVAHDLPNLEKLEAEIQDFRRRITSTGRVTFAARRGKHDDLLIAVALAVWWASRPRFQRRVMRYAIY